MFTACHSSSTVGRNATSWRQNCGLASCEKARTGLEGARSKPIAVKRRFDKCIRSQGAHCADVNANWSAITYNDRPIRMKSDEPEHWLDA